MNYVQRNLYFITGISYRLQSHGAHQCKCSEQNQKQHYYDLERPNDA